MDGAYCREGGDETVLVAWQSAQACPSPPPIGHRSFFHGRWSSVEDGVLVLARKRSLDHANKMRKIKVKREGEMRRSRKVGAHRDRQKTMTARRRGELCVRAAWRRVFFRVFRMRGTAASFSLYRGRTGMDSWRTRLQFEASSDRTLRKEIANRG